MRGVTICVVLAQRDGTSNSYQCIVPVSLDSLSI
jgi:hypothetical protein